MAKFPFTDPTGAVVLPLTDKDKQRLAHLLTDYTRDLEKRHSRYFFDLRRWIDWRDAKPLVERRSFPFQDASNIVVPVIAGACQSTHARFFSLLHSSPRRLWTSGTQNERFAQNYEAVVLDFMNTVGRREMDMFWGPMMGLDEFVANGSCVFGLTWREQIRHLLLPDSKRPQPVVMKRGPQLTHWPAEHILWEWGVPIQEAEAVITQTFYTWSRLVGMGHSQGWDMDAIKATKRFPTAGSPGADIYELKAQRAGLDPEMTIEHGARYDIRTAWLDVPWLIGSGIDEEKVTLPSDDNERLRVPVIVEFCPDSKQVFRAIANPYLNTDGLPFWDLHFQRRPNQPRGVGLAKMGQHLQAGITAMANQGIDAVTLANSMSFWTTDPKLKGKPIAPGLGIHVSTPNDIGVLAMPKNVMPDIGMANFLQAWWERISLTTDPLMGRESRSGGHPSPATNFLGMLQQSQEMASPQILQIRRQFSKIGEAAAAFYQLFDTDPDGRIERWMGEVDARSLKEWMFPTDMTIPGTAEFDLYVLSETENPQAEMQKAMVLSQMNQNYFASILRVLPALESPQTPPLVKSAIVKSLDAMGKLHQKFLESGAYDEAKELIFNLEEEQNRLESINALRQLAQSAMGPQQPGPGGIAPGASPGAALGPQFAGAIPPEAALTGGMGGGNGAAPVTQ